MTHPNNPYGSQYPQDRSDARGVRGSLQGFLQHPLISDVAQAMTPPVQQPQDSAGNTGTVANAANAAVHMQPAPVSQPSPANDAQHNVLASDADRTDAINTLGAHFAEGRLRVHDYDERTARAIEAVTIADLNALFVDLPALSPDMSHTPEGMYSAREIEQFARQGKRVRAGFMAISILLMFAIVIAMGPQSTIIGPMSILLPAFTFVLLYLFRVGPDSWHRPSQAQLDRQRIKKMKMQQEIQRQNRRAVRREMTSDLTENALRFANKKLRKF